MAIPLQLKPVVEVMKDFPKPWFICGGWAIDLYLDKQTREHSDVDIGIFFEDQIELQNYVKDWNIYKIVDGKMEEWMPGEILVKPIHELKAVKGDQEIEILLNNSNENEWIYRRDETIRYPKEKLVHYRGGIPYWAPEVSLLYKTKTTRPQDEQDFTNVLPRLSEESKQWLKSAIRKNEPEHSWLSSL